MFNIEAIEEQLADEDGSLRDINIEKLDHQDLEKLVAWYSKNYKVSLALNSEGEDIKAMIGTENFINKFQNYVIIYATSSVNNILIKDLNFFIIKNVDGSYAIEMDFKPRKIKFDEFCNFLKQILDCTKKREYYVKYENVSWKYGDVSEGSGVIFSCKNVII